MQNITISSTGLVQVALRSTWPNPVNKPLGSILGVPIHAHK